jgi:cell division protein FtsQ
MFRRRSLVPPEKAKRNSKRPKAPEPEPRVAFRERVARSRERIGAWWTRARRPVMLVLRIAMLCILVAAALAVGRLVERHVRTSPAFATQEIQISGNERLDQEEILEAASLAVGQNVFEIGPEDAQARLLRHPWIASAEVSRRLPGFFDVLIREHHAVAVISLSESDDDPAGIYLVAEDGTVFKRVGEGDPVDLPVVTGIARGRFIRDRAFRQSVLLEVVALLHDYRGAGLWRRMPIGEIHVESDDGLSLYVGADALHVRLGRGPFRQKLRRLRRVLDQIEEQGSKAAYVYLDNVRRPDRVTVRLRD